MIMVAPAILCPHRRRITDVGHSFRKAADPARQCVRRDGLLLADAGSGSLARSGFGGAQDLSLTCRPATIGKGKRWRGPLMKIFLSYASERRAVAEPIAFSLRDRGFEALSRSRPTCRRVELRRADRNRGRQGRSLRLSDQSGSGRSWPLHADRGRVRPATLAQGGRIRAAGDDRRNRLAAIPSFLEEREYPSAGRQRRRRSQFSPSRRWRARHRPPGSCRWRSRWASSPGC